MANKKINQLDSRSGASLSDLSLVGDPINGVSYKLTLTQISTLMGVPGKFNQPTGTTAQYLRGDGSLATFPVVGNGTVTSVDMSVPTGLTISGNPITSSGSIAVGLASGYSIPTTASQATWDAAYNDKINSAAVTGTTTKTLTLTQQDGGTVTASWTDDNTDAVTSVFGRTGAVVATGGDYTTTQVTEGTNLYFTGDRVRATLLTGLNLVGGGTIAATDSILQAFGKTQNQISALVGGVNYDGVWNASTNTPAIVSSVGSKGDYYVVNVAGSTNIDGITDWKVGDWIIYNGTTWDKVDNTDAVSSVNGFTGAVSLTTANISEVTNLYYTEARVSANTDVAANTAARHNAVTLGTANGLSLSTQALSLALSSASTTGALSSTDWTTFNNKQNTLTNPVTGTGTTNYLPKWTSGSALGNSLVYDDGTNVGIGTANPAYKMHLFNSGSVTSAIEATGAGADSVLRFISPTQYWTITNDGVAGNLTLNRGGNNLFRFSALGNLLVGSTADNGNRCQITGDLFVSANISIGISTAACSLHIERPSTDNIIAAIGQSGYEGALFLSGAGSGKDANIVYGNGRDLHFFSSSSATPVVDGTLRLTIASTGAATFSSSVTATSFIKSGGTSSQYLMADGSVTTGSALTITNRQTASYTLALTDADKLVEMNVAIANNLTVPLNSSIAFAIGTKIDIAQYGAGQTTVVATSGVSVRSAGGALKLALQYSGASLVKIATNEWYLFGDITV